MQTNGADFLPFGNEDRNPTNQLITLLEQYERICVHEGGPRRKSSAFLFCSQSGVY